VSDDKVVPLRHPEAQKSEALLAHQEQVRKRLEWLVEVGLTQYTGDGTDRFHLTRRGWQALPPLLALAQLTAREQDEEYDEDSWVDVMRWLNAMDHAVLP
jgi:hypothetical protein